MVGAHEGLCSGFGKTCLPAQRLILGMWISTARHSLMPDIKHVTCVAKGECIFMEAMGEKKQKQKQLQL